MFTEAEEFLWCCFLPSWLLNCNNFVSRRAVTGVLTPNIFSTLRHYAWRRFVFPKIDRIARIRFWSLAGGHYKELALRLSPRRITSNVFCVYSWCSSNRDRWQHLEVPPAGSHPSLIQSGRYLLFFAFFWIDQIARVSLRGSDALPRGKSWAVGLWTGMSFFFSHLQ